MLRPVDPNYRHHKVGSSAVPGVCRGPEANPGPVLFTLDVDGEVFTVRQGTGGGFAYEWVSGPNPGYGFGTSGPPSRTADEHRDDIRGFLAMIDPATGFIADD
jgi:hypothetical protein